MNNNLSPITLTCLLLGAAACGKSTPTSALTRPTAASGSITSAQAASIAGDNDFQNFATAGTNLTDGSNNDSLGSMSSQFMAAHLANTALDLKSQTIHTQNTFRPLSGTCDPTVTPTTLTDADHDLIPVTSTSTFACTVAAFDLTVSGTKVLVDKDDADAFGGFSFSISDLTFALTGITAKFNASVASTKVSATSYTGNFDLAGDVVSTTSGHEGTVSFGVFIDMAITPDISATTPNLSGTFTKFSGFFKASSTLAAAPMDTVLALTSTGLKYSAAGQTCSTAGFSDGSMSLTDGANHVLKVTYSNVDSVCSAVYTFDNAVITPTLN